MTKSRHFYYYHENFGYICENHYAKPAGIIPAATTLTQRQSAFAILGDSVLVTCPPTFIVWPFSDIFQEKDEHVIGKTAKTLQRIKVFCLTELFSGPPQSLWCSYRQPSLSSETRFLWKTTKSFQCTFRVHSMDGQGAVDWLWEQRGGPDKELSNTQLNLDLT